MATELSFPVQESAEAAAGGSWWDSWAALAAEPALVEFLLFSTGAILLLMLNLRVSRLVRAARDRAAVKDYLLGVEQSLSGDLDGARQRLERVLAEDPENHHARLMYGEVLAGLGEAAEAHRQHVFLQKSFRMDSLRNELGLVSALLRARRPEDAVDSARRAVRAHPEDRSAVELLFQAELAAGFPEEAGRTGARLARLLRGL